MPFQREGLTKGLSPFKRDTNALLGTEPATSSGWNRAPLEQPIIARRAQRAASPKKASGEMSAGTATYFDPAQSRRDTGYPAFSDLRALLSGRGAPPVKCGSQGLSDRTSCKSAISRLLNELLDRGADFSSRSASCRNRRAFA
jgi:hypothetical protein